MKKSLEIITIAGVIFIILILFMLFMDKIFMPVYIHHNKEIVLPDIVGMTYKEGRQLLKSKGFKFIVEDRIPDGSIPPDIILAQNPVGNSIIRKGRRVYITLSALANPVVVPSLVGDSEREAQFKISKAGLKLGSIEREFSSFFPEGVIMNQSPIFNSRIKKGSEVAITVSLGRFPDEIIVPDVMGKNYEIVKEIIKKAGLVVGNLYYVADNDLLPNTVLGMAFKDEPITYGMVLKPDDKIDIILSKIDTAQNDSLIY